MKSFKIKIILKVSPQHEYCVLDTGLSSKTFCGGGGKMSALSFVYTPVLAHVLWIDALKRQVRT